MNVRSIFAAFSLALLASQVTPSPALAVTAEVAKACRTLTAKQFPPRAPANPAAGSAKGSGRDQTAYFNKCVANGGKVDDGAAK